MRRKATVASLLSQNRAELIVRRESACSGECHKCGGCGGVEQTLRLQAENPVGARPGDIVWIESETAVVLKAAALVYLLPLLLFLVVYLLCYSRGLWALLFAAGAFALGLLPAFLYDRRVKRTPPAYKIVGFVK